MNDSKPLLNATRNLVVNTSTTVPSSQLHVNHDAALQPVLVAIYFSGIVPKHLLDINIPIQISVTMSEEYASLMEPVVETVSWPEDTSDSADSDEEMCQENDIEYEDCHQDVLIPFLPLSRNFDRSNPADWSILANSIQDWLLHIESTTSQYWSWGRDAFWLAFIAANPGFPNGRWALWDARVPLEGQFIEQWLSESKALDTAVIADTLNFIWAEFCKHAALFYTYPLVSAS
ncbi:hypothetical protein BJ138DRAFT_1187413 [Hygrophoropsis aurantiaca]|uniref:Uncharacterized protein n=1 Tax=Hygrophoropsis aurantiaca TaxID=72124 RepID=A0ACB7ZUH2_9AGAM|nr:hypothetical protein BJ138DRAFT_1187413 [Hygrophoropsis aurantiaca]